MTDACLLIGIIDGDAFAGGSLKLESDLARRAFENLDTVFSFEERVRNSYEMGLHNIAEGITNIAIKYGLDPRDFSLMAFGAAGPMLLPAILDKVGVAQVVVPPYPGLFSALGLLSSDLIFSDSRSAYTMLSRDSAEDIAGVYDRLEQGLLEQLGDRAPDNPDFTRSFDGRLQGQSWETPFVPVPDGELDGEAIDKMIVAFHDAYEVRAGHRLEAFPVQGVTYRVHLSVQAEKVAYPILGRRPSGEEPTPSGHVKLEYLDPADAGANVFRREDLLCGDTLAGPAIIREPTSTTHVKAGQRLKVGERGELIIALEDTERGDRS